MGVSGPSAAGSTGTNLDVGGIVNKLMAVEQKPLNALNAKEAGYQAKISAFGQVKSAMSAFQTSLQGLGSNSKFQGNNATSSDPSSLTVAAMSSASVGHHSIDITSLAEGQRLVAPGIPSDTAAIGNGTLTFDLGTVSGGEFTPNIGKYRATTLDGTTVTNRVIDGKPGTTISLADTTTLTPDPNSSGTIPAGTLTINGVEVDKIRLLDEDSPLHRAINIAEALDDAYVESGGEAGTFTASQGKIIIKSETGGKHITFGIAGKATDTVTAAKTLETLSKQLGLSQEQLGSQSHGNSIVTVANTNGLSIGDPISGNGFPEGTTIASIIDTTHFLTTDAGKEGDGVTLNTSSASGSKTIAIDSSNNTLQGIRDAINSAKIGITASVVNDGSAALQGDSAMRSLESQIDGILSTPLSSPAGSMTTLSQIGISRQANGSLAIDSTKFNTALGTKFDEVAGLFAAIGKTTDEQVNFKATNALTIAGSYGVSVTGLATQGSSVGDINLNARSTTIEKDTSIKVAIDGVSASIPLTAGAYSSTQLASMVQSAINSTKTFSAAGKSVSATIGDNGSLNVSSNTYGAASSVNLENGAGTSISEFMGSATKAKGTDASGMIDGAPAAGTGQLLTSNTGKSSGMQVQIAGGPLGDRGSVTYTQGFAHKLNNYVNLALSNNGVLTGRINGLGTSVRGIGKERDTINTRLVSVEDRYRRQYTKLDATLGKMNETSTYLSQQLSKL